MKTGWALSTMFLAPVLVILAGAAPVLAGENWEGNLNLALGNKMMDYEDWSPADDLYMAGLMFDARGVDWPVSFALDVFHAWDEDEGQYSASDNSTDTYYARYDIRTTTVMVGARKELGEFVHFVPYLNGGLAAVFANGEVEYSKSKFSEDDVGYGIWLGTGAYYRFSESVNLGLDFRYSWAECNISQKKVDGNCGGIQLAVVGGLHW